MKISIIIPAYNEAVLLPAALAAVMPQAVALEAEVIVIDNASSDNTSLVAAQAGAKVVHEPTRGYVHALQRGLHEATGDVVVITDADSRVQPGWLQTIYDTLLDPTIVSVTGPVRFQRMRWLTWWRAASPATLVGSNMAVRRTAALSIGGFDTRFNLAADVDFSYRLRGHGRMVYRRGMAVSTSARRFQASPLREGGRYVLNYLWMALFDRPLFWHFAPIRQDAAELARQERRHTALTVLLSMIIFLAYLFLWPYSSDFGQDVVRGQTKQKLVALTFDDGPNGQATRSIVNILSVQKVPATFFEVGRSVAADPATARYVANHGFTIGNHSWDHAISLPYFTPRHIRAELTQTSAAIVNATGQQPIYFRPPHGLRSPQLLYEASRLHLKVIDWSVDPQDYLHNNANIILRDVLSDVRPGSIVLLHDGLQDGPRAKTLLNRQALIAALPNIIIDLRQRGYTFVSLQKILPVSHHFRFSLLHRPSNRASLR